MASEYLKWKYRDVKPDEPVRYTPAEKRRNWRHYHKWHVVIGVVLALAVGNILYHVLGIGQVRPDYQIAYVGAGPLPAAALLMADITDCDSYFFLLDDPGKFQQDYQVLRRLDGSLPADSDRDYERCCLTWADCPALTGLDLGSYSENLLGQEVSGDSQELLSGLYLARRGFWTDRTTDYADGCDALWAELAKGAF